MKDKIIPILLILSICHVAHAQTISDAVRYSEVLPLGTARTVGVGSSFGAMGGDFSVITINPAGLGTYFKNEFTITPGLGLSATDPVVQGGDNLSTTTNSTGFGIDNIGYVSSSFQSDYNLLSASNSNWIASNFGIGLSKSKSFKKNFEYSDASEGSISERWVQLADGTPSENLDEFETGPALEAGVLIPIEENLYDTDYFDDDVVAKEEVVNQSGYINELNVAWAGNYKNKLNIGIGAGIPFLSFTEEKQYNESVNAVDENSNPIFQNSLGYTQYLNTTGAGINFKAGLIYNLNPIRIGAAVHTPTWYALNDDFNSQVAYSYEYFSDPVDSGSSTGDSPDGSFSYNFSTPWKFIGSIGSLLKFGDIKGFINADVEYINYSSSSFNLTSDSNNFGDAEYERELNEDISQELQNAALNIRIGAELALKKFRLRGGYSVNKSPYLDRESDNAISFGTGYRGNSFFLDLAYRISSDYEFYSPYTSAFSSRDIDVDVDDSRGRLVATFGFKF